MGRPYKEILDLMQEQGAVRNPSPPYLGTVTVSTEFKMPLKVFLNGAEFTVTDVLAGAAADVGDTVLVVRTGTELCVVGKVVKT